MTASNTWSIRRSNSTDLDGVRKLLTGAGLPVLDLENASGLRFWVTEDGNRLIGAIGLEPFGAAGLLRSLVVSPSHRQQGLGTALVAALERELTAEGVEALVLLTETAESFFEGMGYTVTDRAHVPDAIKQSAEFRSLCPASAVCMTKSLSSARARVSHG
jgi:N-acetylglutamate synthase-like GNAT family acetyltransferase